MPLGLFERVKFGKTKPFCLISAHFIYPVIKSSAQDNTPVCIEALPLLFSKSSQPNCPPFFLQWLSHPASRRTHWALSFQQRSFLQHKPLEIALSSPCQLPACWMLQFLPSVRELFKYPPKLFTIFQEWWILSLSHKASWRFHPVHFSCWNLFLTHFFVVKSLNSFWSWSYPSSQIQLFSHLFNILCCCCLSFCFDTIKKILPCHLHARASSPHNAFINLCFQRSSRLCVRRH